ncbi:hypothetical protein [Streptomyces sp. NPDC020571]|uniref:hypothetical protein n=1 Tax=Streptomyces sp. NPDC020571 TaxID=3365079 RepID=UPI0037B96537
MGIRIEAEAGCPVDDEVERVLGLAEAVGEPVTVTFVWEGGPAPAARGADARGDAGPLGALGAHRLRGGRPGGGARAGPPRGDPAEAHWLEERARDVRQGFMDPKQRAAFQEFLARQAARGEQ